MYSDPLSAVRSQSKTSSLLSDICVTLLNRIHICISLSWQGLIRSCCCNTSAKLLKKCILSKKRLDYQWFSPIEIHKTYESLMWLLFADKYWILKSHLFQNCVKKKKMKGFSENMTDVYKHHKDHLLMWIKDHEAHCVLVIIRFSIWLNAVTEQPYCSPKRNRHYRGCQDNQPWFTEPQIGLHLGLEALAMRLSRCCASQPITGEIEEKDDIIGKLGQMQGVFWLSSPPACQTSVTVMFRRRRNV